MEIFGKSTINPLLYYSGKIVGYIVWIILALSLLNISKIEDSSFYYAKVISIFLLCIGLLFAFFSLINLGRSTRLGLPKKPTIFKENGIYRISRNPMYIGFGLITISSMIYTMNLLVGIMGIYSLFVYHLIILSEEKFLENRFGRKYIEYKKKVRRYL